VANDGSANISAYSLSNGVPTQTTGSPFTASTNPSFVTVDPTGKFLLEADGTAKTINEYSIAAGVLTANGNTVTLNSAPALIFTTP